MTTVAHAVRTGNFLAFAVLTALALTFTALSVPTSSAAPTTKYTPAVANTTILEERPPSLARKSPRGVRFKKKRTVLRLTKKRRKVINKEHRSRGRAKLPYCAKKYIIKRNGKGKVRGVANRCQTPARHSRSLVKGFAVTPKGFWGWWDDAWEYTKKGVRMGWKVTKCAAAIVAVVWPASKAFKAMKALGGIKESAVLIIRAGNKKDAAKLFGGAIWGILGIAAVEDYCL